MGKVIYQPKGKAREYAAWACNLYLGCSNDCAYCFNKRGALGTVSGGHEPTLKKRFKDEPDAFGIFMKELTKHKEQIIADGGLLFSFTTDPCLPETIRLTFTCIRLATSEGVPCHILTKRADWTLNTFQYVPSLVAGRKLITVGFTLTGRDDLEPGASTNGQRIAAMKRLHKIGIKTFASLEPVIDFESTLRMIRDSLPYCDLYKVGLISGSHPFTNPLYKSPEFKKNLTAFIDEANSILTEYQKPIYWKKSVRKTLGHDIAAPCLVDNRYDPLTAIRIIKLDEYGNLSWDELERLSKDAGAEYSILHHEATPAIRRQMRETLRNAVYPAGPADVLDFIHGNDLVFTSDGIPFRQTY
jgi:DNA repair photolyase